MASVRQSSIVCATIGWSIGTSIGPPGSVSGQARTCGKAAASRSFGAHPLERRGDPLAVARALEEKRTLRVPAPPRLEEGLSEDGLDQDVARPVRVQVVEDVFQREAVLRPEREDDRLLVRGRLQLEAEADAELLAQRQAPGAVDPGPEGRVHDELHAAALVEEALEDHALGRRDRAEDAPPRLHVLGDLERRGRRQGVSADRLKEDRGLVFVAPRTPRAARRSRPRARACARAPRRARTGATAALPSRRRRARCRARCAGRATTRCRAGRCRRRSPRPPSPR